MRHLGGGFGRGEMGDAVDDSLFVLGKKRKTEGFGEGGAPSIGDGYDISRMAPWAHTP